MKSAGGYQFRKQLYPSILTTVALQSARFHPSATYVEESGVEHDVGFSFGEIIFGDGILGTKHGLWAM